jgi:hypothetical protein
MPLQWVVLFGETGAETARRVGLEPAGRPLMEYSAMEAVGPGYRAWREQSFSRAVVKIGVPVPWMTMAPGSAQQLAWTPDVGPDDRWLAPFLTRPSAIDAPALLGNILLLALPAIALAALVIRRLPGPRHLIVSVALAYPLVIGVAWACGLAHRTVIDPDIWWTSSPDEFAAEVGPLTAPGPEASWSRFNATRYRTIGVDTWAAVHVFVDEDDGQRPVRQAESTSLGWPVTAVRGGQRVDPVIWPGWVTVVQAPVWWPGMLVAWLLYAAAIDAAIVGPLALRAALRRRRGRCVRCGYPLLEASDRCSECGSRPR